MASELDLDAIEQRANAATTSKFDSLCSTVNRAQGWMQGIAVAVRPLSSDSYNRCLGFAEAMDIARVDAIREHRTMLADIPALIARVRELEAADTEVSRASVALAERVRKLEAIIEATARESECVSINADVWVQTNDDATGKPWLVMRNNEIIGDADTLWDAIEKGLADGNTKEPT